MSPESLRPIAGFLERPWRLPRTTLLCGGRTLFMGIVNVTPDSFSDGGRFTDLDQAVARGLELVAQGADILDVGGESTRPGAAPVGVAEELRRVVPAIEALAAATPVPISIDTMKAEVARAALAAGAQIVNDVSGLTHDPGMPEVCAAGEAGVVCMHMQGTPQTMQLAPAYGDVVREVADYLAERVEELVRRGVARDAVVLDPGLGFGKTAEHNLQLLAGIPTLRSLGLPVLIGHSRKRFLGKILGKPVDERGAGTIGISLAAAALGADLLRLHDVAPSRECLLAWNAVAQASSPV